MVLQAPRSHVSSYVAGASRCCLCSDLWFLACASYLRRRIVENTSLTQDLGVTKTVLGARPHAGEKGAQLVLFTQRGFHSRPHLPPKLLSRILSSCWWERRGRRRRKVCQGWRGGASRTNQKFLPNFYSCPL